MILAGAAPVAAMALFGFLSDLGSMYDRFGVKVLAVLLWTLICVSLGVVFLRMRRPPKVVMAALAVLATVALCGFWLLPGPLEGRGATATGSFKNPDHEVPVGFSAAIVREAKKCSEYWVPQTRERIQPPPAANDTLGWRNWVKSTHAIDTWHTRLTITLANDNPRPVTVREIRVNVLSRDAMPQGLRVSGQCGGPRKAASGLIDLAQKTAHVQPNTAEGALSIPAAVRADPLQLPLEVTKAHNETIILEATSKEHVKWTMELNWATGGSEGHLQINSDGQPFETGRFQAVRATPCSPRSFV